MERDGRPARRHEGHEEARCPPRQQQAGEAPKRGEDDVLDEQLTDEPPAAGAKRKPHRELRQSRRRTGEDQAGDIGTGNQQDNRDDCHQDEQGL